MCATIAKLNYKVKYIANERGSDQNEIFIREKQYDATTDSGLFTPSDTTRKVLNSFRANALYLVVSTALRFKLVKKMIHATKKKSHSFLEGKCHLVLYLALNLNAYICLHPHIKRLNISTAEASQRKTTNEKFLLFVNFNIMGYVSSSIFFYFWSSLIKAFYYLFLKFKIVEVCYMIIK